MLALQNIRVVLIATSHPGNIGSTARAMKTMGVCQLYLVSPKSFPHQTAFELAAGADDILEEAIVVDSLAEAIKDCHIVFATSARPRDISLPEFKPAEAADYIVEHFHQNIAIVFGREHAGLTNEEFLHCHYHIHIPANPNYSSLNLAQAVQVVVYEIRMKALKAADSNLPCKKLTLAKNEELIHFYRHLEEILIDIDFLKLSNPKKLMYRLKRLFNRVQLEQVEINILRGILTHIQFRLKNDQKE